MENLVKTPSDVTLQKLQALLAAKKNRLNQCPVKEIDMVYGAVGDEIANLAVYDDPPVSINLH